MPTCMWASTQPGKAKSSLASNASPASSARISAASRATLPFATPMSRQSTPVAFGRTTRAFLITRSKVFISDSRFLFRIGGDRAAASPPPRSLPGLRFEAGIASASLQHFRRADQLIEPGEIEHAPAERRGAAVRLERGIEFLGGPGDRAHDAGGKDHDGEAERLELARR